MDIIIFYVIYGCSDALELHNDNRKLLKKRLGKSTYVSMSTAFSIEQFINNPLTAILMSISAHKRPHDQNLFGIVQGGLDPVLRLIIILTT